MGGSRKERSNKRKTLSQGTKWESKVGRMKAEARLLGTQLRSVIGKRGGVHNRKSSFRKCKALLKKQK